MAESKVTHHVLSWDDDDMTKLEQAARQLLVVLESGMIDINAVIALREALSGGDVSPIEQAEQEPVAWKDMAFARLGVVRDKMRPDDVAVVQRFLDGDYAAPVRTKYLTDCFIEELHKDAQDPISFARAVIAADREKNK